MSQLAKSYEPQAVEEKWYAWWLEQGHFVANPASPKPAYSLVIPPPNVTGVLTLGHVLNNTIQDILARRARLRGHEVLWLPGTDHAGIATQTVVERKLRKEQKKTRHDLGREEFLESSVAMERSAWRNNYRAAQEARVFVRLEPRTVHHGRGLCPSGAGSVRRPLPQRADLSRQTDGQLVSGIAHRLE